MSSFDPRQMFSPSLKGNFWTPVKAISRPPLSADQTVCESFETLYITPFFREWVKAKEKEIYVLLNETPPNGAKYTKFIKHLLEREGHWVKWKNDGCPKFMKEKGKWVQSSVLAVSGLFNWKESRPNPIIEELETAPPAKKRRTLYDDIMNDRKLGLGSAELTKLWVSWLFLLLKASFNSRENLSLIWTHVHMERGSLYQQLTSISKRRLCTLTRPMKLRFDSLGRK